MSEADDKTRQDDAISEIEELFDSIDDIQALYTDYFFKNEYELEIDAFYTDSIVIIFSSDVHFGSIFTDYKKLLEIWKAVLENDHVYLAIVGDFIDNFELNSLKLLQSSVNAQAITPALQRDIFVKLLNALLEKKKLLACVLGNHESFTPSHPYVQLLNEKNVALARNRLYLTLKLRYHKYRIAFVHRSKYNSFLNPVHSSMRELTTLYPDADIVVTSHTHLPAMMVYPYPRNGKYTERILIKTGTLKSDPYQCENFSPYPVEDISTPAVILRPGESEMLPFFRFETAMKVQKFAWRL